jgi:hypothetical protein
MHVSGAIFRAMKAASRRTKTRYSKREKESKARVEPKHTDKYKWSQKSFSQPKDFEFVFSYGLPMFSMDQQKESEIDLKVGPAQYDPRPISNLQRSSTLRYYVSR